MGHPQRSENLLGASLGCLMLAAILAMVLGAPEQITSCLGGTAAFLLGVAFALGIVLTVAQQVANRIPRLRNVRFADAELRAITPARLRWLGGNFGRPVRPGSAGRRAVQNGLAFWGAMALIPLTLLATVCLMALAFLFDDTLASMGLFFGSAFAGGYGVLKLKRRLQRLKKQRRQLLALTASEALVEDTRPPVVLLRSFRDDGREVGLLDEGGFPITLEETLEARLSRHGPVVAIGQPGEGLPLVGASRDYVADDWQERVGQLVEASALIVAILDRTSGLLWEIEQVFAQGRHGSLVFVVPDEQVMELSRRWLAVRRRAAAIRPELVGDRLRISMRKTLAVVFEPDGRARRIICRNRLRRSYGDALALALWYSTYRNQP